jgi:cephalosporin hydroxylase
MTDDRSSFEANRRAKSLSLGQDADAFARSIDAIVAADRHDYPYLWTWWGLPIIQLPADVMATQEAVFAAQPDIIIETGVARGGSMIFLASLIALLGRGKVVGIDIDIRAHNRQVIEQHPMAKHIRLIEGASTGPATIEAVRREIPPGAKVMAILDSDHSRDHVLAELRAYGPLVTVGQYLIVADTLLGRLDERQTPTRRSQVLLKGNEPLAAVSTYLAECDRFVPDPELNGKLILSSSVGGYLKCHKD